MKNETELIGLNFNPHTSNNPEDFIPVLNEMSNKSIGAVRNVGLYAQITSIEHNSKIILADYETYVSIDKQTKEVAGTGLKKEGINKDPWKLSFKSLFK